MSAQDGFGVPAGGVGSTDTNGDAGGAAGGDNGDAWSISTGGIVGISVSIAVVVLAIGKYCHLPVLWEEKLIFNYRRHVVAMVCG